MLKYKTKISGDGRIVIPAPCRHYLQLKPGEELIIRIDNGELHLLSAKQLKRKRKNL